jgi:TIR domain/Bacterial SH3 domain
MPQSSSKQFSGIFISYRREDSSGHAGRLFDKLVDHFGKNRIFMDIDTIEPGEDFVTVIQNAVGSCQILIAIIGRHWLSSTDGSFRRLDSQNDFVRLEIVAALNRDIRVIPVLVQGAAMPKAEDLPDDLSKLSRRNGFDLSDLRWQRDVNELINALEKILVQLEASARVAEAKRQAEDERVRREADERSRHVEASKRRAEVEHVRAETDRRRLEVEAALQAERTSLNKKRERREAESRTLAEEENLGIRSEEEAPGKHRNNPATTFLPSAATTRAPAFPLIEKRSVIRVPAHALTQTHAGVRKGLIIIVLGILVAVIAGSGIFLLVRKLVTQSALSGQTVPTSASVVGAEGIAMTDLNVRADPSVANEPIGLAENGSRVRILSSKSEWYEIQILQHGRIPVDTGTTRSEKGWVQSKYIKLAAP